MPISKMNFDGWFISKGAVPETAPRIFTFVHAGGRVDQFLDWQELLDSSARIVGMCPPGSGHRFEEERPKSIAEMAASAAEKISESCEAPIYLFGHSLGAVVAFETARRLARTPAALIVSGCAAPPLLPSERVIGLAAAPIESFARDVRFFGGMPPSIRPDSAEGALVLNRLRLDFTLVADYTYQPSTPLGCPVICVLGDTDPHVDSRSVRRWQEVSEQPVEHSVLPGGHFYFDPRPDGIVELLRQTVERGNQPSECDVRLI